MDRGAKNFEQEIKAFVREIMPRDVETGWKREFPRDIFEKLSKKGCPGAEIPNEYGGLGLGGTGGCIAAEALNCMPGPGRAFAGTMLGAKADY